MKFSIMKVTSDDEYPRYRIDISSVIPVGKDKGTLESFCFYCNESDIGMMQNGLNLERKPHPQQNIKGCPCKGFKTCDECAADYRRVLSTIRKGER